MVTYTIFVMYVLIKYCKYVLEFRSNRSDKMAYANSADPDQTAPESDQGLHCLPVH